MAQQRGDALQFAKSYTVTGDYAVGGVDLQPASTSTGFLTGTIPMTGVPANADILAAFLYWETISTNPAQTAGVKFRGQPITVVKTAKKLLTSEFSQCWTSGARAECDLHVEHVPRRCLAVVAEQLDVDGKTTGRRLVNDVDLINAGFARHTVTLPEAGTAIRPAKRGRVVVCRVSRPGQAAHQDCRLRRRLRAAQGRQDDADAPGVRAIVGQPRRS